MSIRVGFSVALDLEVVLAAADQVEGEQLALGVLAGLAQDCAAAAERHTVQVLGTRFSVTSSVMEHADAEHF